MAFFAQRGVKLECCTSFISPTVNVGNAYTGFDPIGTEKVGKFDMQLTIIVPVKNNVLDGNVEYSVFPRE